MVLGVVVVGFGTILYILNQRLRELKNSSAVELIKSDVTEFKYLVKVGGHLSLDNTKIESLPMLSTVKNILYLANTEIKSLPEGLEVGMSLILKNTPLSKTTTEEELRNKIKVKDKIIL